MSAGPGTRVTVEDISAWYAARVGRHLGHSRWFEVTQADVTAFAELTRDGQWIHVDPDRAAEGPYGGPVAHGFHTLALISYLTSDLLDLDWTELGVNYGLDNVRFRAPVRVGVRVRAGATLRRARLRPRGYLELTLGVAVEIEHENVPACTADHVRLYQAAADARLPRDL
ncbi:MaoC family dehydratase [Nonomuraea sp. NPDC003707]